MTSTAVLTKDATTIVSEGSRHFHWGAAIAGAIAATATTIFLVTLGSGIGLAVVSGRTGLGAFLTLGAIYVFAAQAFGFVVGGYVVGRLIGPEAETSKEEEFRAAAHGFTVWGLTVIAGLLAIGLTTAWPRPAAPATAPSTYWLDVLFRPAPNTAAVAADKAEVGRIWIMGASGNADRMGDNDRVAHLVAQDAGISRPEALSRVQSVETSMRHSMALTARAAAYGALWTALALLFGAILAVASAISARWMDDKVTFGFTPRNR